MCTELSEFEKSRRNVIRATLQLSAGIASVRQHLDRAGGLEYKDLYDREERCERDSNSRMSRRRVPADE
jgi:hypothetical protein